MHDITHFESQGLPAVYVASDEFVNAGRLQAEALGFEPEAVFVSHPIQDRDDEEIRSLADGAVDQIVGVLIK